MGRARFSRGRVCYSQHILNIPDELAPQVAPEGKDPARIALEAFALEGYRAELLSESALRQIMLATELCADQLIVDHPEGRRRAEERRIPVIGALGVLKEAAILGLLGLRAAMERLQTTSFYVAPEVLKRLQND